MHNLDNLFYGVIVASMAKLVRPDKLPTVVLQHFRVAFAHLMPKKFIIRREESYIARSRHKRFLFLERHKPLDHRLVYHKLRCSIFALLQVRMLAITHFAQGAIHLQRRINGNLRRTGRIDIHRQHASHGRADNEFRLERPSPFVEDVQLL